MKSVLLIGGSGFVGRSVAEALTKAGYAVTVPTRDRERAKRLLLLPTVDVVSANVNQPGVLESLMRDQSAVINLVGILAGDFERAHVEFPQRVAEACVAAGVSRLVQMSALGAEITAPSQYLQSRARGEHAVWRVAKDHPGLGVTVFQPSVIFGADDNFLNMLKRLVGLFPVIPLGSPNARFQPVWVEDVAHAIVTSLSLQSAEGHTYPLIGPREYTMRQLLEFVMDVSGQSRVVLPLGPALSNLQALAFEFPPLKWVGAALGVILTRDNVRSMQVPNVSDQAFPQEFGKAADLESIATSYLRGTVGRLRYQSFRDSAGR